MAQAPETIPSSTVINDRDHGALVKVAAGFCTALMLLSLSARLQIRWPWRSLFGKDDIAAVVASAFAVAQMLVVLLAVSRGFGKVADDLSPASIDAIEKIVYASDILFVMTLFLSKLAVSLLYGRLSRGPALARAITVLVVMPCVCGLLSVVLVAVPTSDMRPWVSGPEIADGRVVCWIAVTGMSLLIELALLIFPIWLVKDLQMNRGPKTLIVLAAWIRLPLIPISILRLLNLSKSIRAPDFTFHYSTTEIYTQVEMTYALINATALCLHKFLRFANSGIMDLTVGTGGLVETMYGTSSKGRSKQSGSNRSHNLKGFDSVKLGAMRRSQTTANAVHADSISVASDSSQRNIVVRQTVDVQYGRPDGESQRGIVLQPGAGEKF